MENYDDEIKKLKDKVKHIEDRVTKLEKTPSIEVDSSLETNIAKNLKNLKNPHLAIICLKMESNQTLDNIKSTLKRWGVNADNWFYHGHFTDYVLKKGFVYSTGKEGNKETFSLTARGIIEYEKIKTKFKL